MQISFLPQSYIGNSILDRKISNIETEEPEPFNEDTDDYLINSAPNTFRINNNYMAISSDNFSYNVPQNKTIKIKKIKVGSNTKNKYQTPDKEYSIYSQRSQDIKDIENQWSNFVNKRVISIEKLRVKKLFEQWRDKIYEIDMSSSEDIKEDSKYISPKNKSKDNENILSTTHKLGEKKVSFSSEENLIQSSKTYSPPSESHSAPFTKIKIKKKSSKKKSIQKYKKLENIIKTSDNKNNSILLKYFSKWKNKDISPIENVLKKLINKLKKAGKDIKTENITDTKKNWKLFQKMGWKITKRHIYEKCNIN
jgi:hypothetical protein